MKKPVTILIAIVMTATSMNAQDIITYKNGNELDKIVYNDTNNKCDDFNCFVKELNDEKNYDLLILSDKKENSDCLNKIHYTECPKTTDYINSNIKFLSMEISYNNNSYPIELKNNTYDHYIVNNILNKDFFKYYLVNVLNVEIKDDNFDYTVSIIDHNVNIIELRLTSQIVIKKTDYEFIFNESVSDTNSDTNSDIKQNIKVDGDSFSTNSDKYVNLEVPI